MSKTYWLITSNSKPTPEEKEKTLILHGVNSFNVEELTRVERYNFLYVKKLTQISMKSFISDTLLIQTPHTKHIR